MSFLKNLIVEQNSENASPKLPPKNFSNIEEALKQVGPQTQPQKCILTTDHSNFGDTQAIDEFKRFSNISVNAEEKLKVSKNNSVNYFSS